MNRNISIVTDADNNKIVVINDIIFKGRRSIEWEEVKKYLCNYVDDIYTIADSNDMVYIGKDFPDEYTGSKYTYQLKGAVAKAKANAAQGIPEMNRSQQESISLRTKAINIYIMPDMDGIVITAKSIFMMFWT